MAAILYVRVSTKEQADKKYNLATQEKKVRDFSANQAWPVLELFIDRGESARTEDRPEFQRMLNYCRKSRGKVSHVVVADLSRFARNVRDQANAMYELIQVGVKVVSVDEPITDETAAGKLARNMLGAMNQFFSDSLSEKTKFRMDAGVKAGRWLWVAPLGYLNDMRSKTIVLDPERNALVKKGLELVAAGNYATTNEALKLVTSLGLRTRKGNPVTKQTWQRMLTNPFYYGWIESGENRIKGTHDPLITEQTFLKIQARIGGKSTPHKPYNDDFPLKGLVQCAGCGRNLTAGMVKGRKEKYARYWCWNSQCKRKVGVSSEVLEAKFAEVLTKLKPIGAMLARLPEIATREWEERKDRIAKDAKRLAKLKLDQTELNRKTVRAQIEGKITEDEAKEMKESTKAEIQRIDTQIAALDTERSTLEDLKEQTKAQAFDFGKAWQKADLNQRRELVKALFPRGLPFSNDLGYFEPANSDLKAYLYNNMGQNAWKTPPTFNKGDFEPFEQTLTEEEIKALQAQDAEESQNSTVGVPDGI